MVTLSGARENSMANVGKPSREKTVGGGNLV